MTVRLCQVVALEKGTKNRVHQGFTEVHHNLMKPALLSGISRAYTPKDDDGEKFPSESTKVQLNAEDGIKRAKALLTEPFDITATKDYTNCVAKADVVVDGKTLARNAHGFSPLSLVLCLR